MDGTLEQLLPAGRSLFALRQILRGSSDAQLALQYLFFHADVNDPQVTPLLERHGVPAAAAPAMEDYVCAHLRPWMRKIDGGQARVTSWAEAALREIAPVLGRRPGIEAWALQILNRELQEAGVERGEAWRVALHEGRLPGREADRLVGAIGILQECCGVTVSTAAAAAWKIGKGAAR
jgi:hypothetical protein